MVGDSPIQTGIILKVGAFLIWSRELIYMSVNANQFYNDKLDKDTS